MKVKVDKCNVCGTPGYTTVAANLEEYRDYGWHECPSGYGLFGGGGKNDYKNINNIIGKGIARRKTKEGNENKKS